MSSAVLMAPLAALVPPALHPSLQHPPGGVIATVPPSPWLFLSRWHHLWTNCPFWMLKQLCCARLPALPLAPQQQKWNRETRGNSNIQHHPSAAPSWSQQCSPSVLSGSLLSTSPVLGELSLRGGGNRGLCARFHSSSTSPAPPLRSHLGKLRAGFDPHPSACTGHGDETQLLPAASTHRLVLFLNALWMSDFPIKNCWAQTVWHAYAQKAEAWASTKIKEV